MIAHVSIPSTQPRATALLLAALIDGEAFPFPVVNGAWIAVARDGSGLAVEVYPEGMAHHPGSGEVDPALKPNGPQPMPWEDQIYADGKHLRPSAFHFAMVTPLADAQVLQIANAAGLRAVVCNRGGVLQSADTTFGNLEGYLVDRQQWAGSNGYQNNWAPKELASDLASLGFDLMGSGEGDGELAGQQSTMRILDEVGIKRPGYGPNLSIARQPAFQELPQGRVALVSAFPIGPVASGPIATNKVGNDGAERWGMNPLRLTQRVTVTSDQMAQLNAIRESILARRTEADVTRPTDLPADKPNTLSLLGTEHYSATNRQTESVTTRNDGHPLFL